MNQITAALSQLTPFIRLVALLFGILASWHGLGELFPIIKSVWSPKGTAQGFAIVGAALAIIAGGR